MKHPQSKTFNITINEAQLAHYIKGLRILIESGHKETVYDTTDVMYVDPLDTFAMLMQIQAEDDPEIKTHGLCL